MVDCFFLQPEDDSEVLRLYEAPVEFSGEEMNGRCFDLHYFHQIFVNSKFGSQVEYTTYLADLGRGLYGVAVGVSWGLLQADSAAREPRQGASQGDFNEEFDEKFEAGEIEGWEDRGEVQVPKEVATEIDLETKATFPGLAREAAKVESYISAISYLCIHESLGLTPI
eukprot:scaffold167949_cov49-Prasinocladus_malaysianus.AAC.1